MKKKIFITGGAGFIGSHLVKKILDSGNYHVTIYDNLSSQVHLDFYGTSFYKNIKNKVNFVFGDITNLKLVPICNFICKTTPRTCKCMCNSYV